MDEISPSYRKSPFWQRFIILGLLILFIILFWRDIRLDLLGWWNLIIVVFTRKAVHFDSATLRAMLLVTSNVIVYLLIYLLGLFFVAQFTLPVQRWAERFAIFGRLLLYLVGEHGPIVFVREGKYATRVVNDNNLQPGVALIDLSSAIVIDRPPWMEIGSENRGTVPSGKLIPSSPYRKIPRADREENSNWLHVYGPGVNFIKSGERIHSIVDLRRQARFDSGIKALTRDGIGIETSVFSVFSLSDPPDVIPVAYVDGEGRNNLYGLDIENRGNGSIVIKRTFALDPVDAEEIHRFVESGRVQAENSVKRKASTRKAITPYQFDAERVFMAACAEAGHASPEEKTMLWHQLPQYIAIEAFQNLLAQYPYDSIYSPVFDEGNLDDLNKQQEYKQQREESFIKNLKKEFYRKVMFQGILSYQLLRVSSPPHIPGKHAPMWNVSGLSEGDFNLVRPKSEFERSLVYPLTASKILRDRGIKVVAVGFQEIKAPQEVREKIVENWKARLDRQIKISQAKSEREAMQVINSARMQTQRESTYFLSDIFKKEDHSKEALALLLFQSLENVATDPNNFRDIPPREILAMLQNLHRWLLGERKELQRNKEKERRKEDNPGRQSPSAEAAE